MESLFNPDLALKQTGSPIIHYWVITKPFITQCLKSQVIRVAVSKTQQTSISGLIKNHHSCLNNSWEGLYSVFYPKAAKCRFEVGK